MARTEHTSLSFILDNVDFEHPIVLAKLGLKVSAVRVTGIGNFNLEVPRRLGGMSPSNENVSTDHQMAPKVGDAVENVLRCETFQLAVSVELSRLFGRHVRPTRSDDQVTLSFEEKPLLPGTSCWS